MFRRFPRREQVRLLAYEQVREAEELRTFGCPFLGGPEG